MSKEIWKTGRLLKKAYNTVFSDESVCREQLETAQWFEGTGSGEGQEWGGVKAPNPKADAPVGGYMTAGGIRSLGRQ